MGVERVFAVARLEPGPPGGDARFLGAGFKQRSNEPDPFDLVRAEDFGGIQQVVGAYRVAVSDSGKGAKGSNQAHEVALKAIQDEQVGFRSGQLGGDILELERPKS